MFIGLALFFILAITGYLVIFPLIRRESAVFRKNLSDNPDTDKESLEKTKEAVFTTINEIEFDYKMKKLSEDDYLRLRKQYKKKALELLHEEDELELETFDEEDETAPENDMAGIFEARTAGELAEEVERELEALRRQRRANTGGS